MRDQLSMALEKITSGPEKQRPVVVLIDQDLSFLRKLQRFLARDYTVYTSTGGVEALRLIRGLPVLNALVLRKAQSSLKEIDILRFVHENLPDSSSIVKILISDSPGDHRVIESASTGRVDARLADPSPPEKIRKVLASCLARLTREQRSVMRVPINSRFPIRVDEAGGSRLEVVDISEQGMFFKASSDFAGQGTVPFKILFPDGRTYAVAGRVVRTDRDKNGIGVEFLSMDEENRISFVRSLADGVIMRDLDRLKSRYPFLKTEEMVAFSEETMIESFLGRGLESGTEFVAMQARSAAHEILSLESLHPPLTCVLEGKALNVKFKTSDLIFVSFQIGYSTYSFETMVYRLSRGGRRMECLYPRIIFYSEKRYQKRFKPEGDIRIRIPLPPPYPDSVEGRILDISRDGASFTLDGTAPALLQGTPLDRIQILDGKRLLWEEKGEVRYIAPSGSPASRGIKCGIQFGIARMSIQSSRGPVFDFRRFPRADEKTPRPLPAGGPDHLAQQQPEIIRVENTRGEQIVGLLNSSLPLENKPVPVVLIPPAYGKTKETLFSLALTLVENFFLLGKPLAVLRFDGIRRKGESTKDPDAASPPYEMLHADFTQGASDIRTWLDWLQDNPRLRAGPVILISFSLSALETRIVLRDEAYRRRISYWISCMGTPEFRDLMTRINCGLDFFEQYKLGIQLGVMPVLGNLVDVDPYVADGVANSVATIGQAREDMRRFDLPITWIYGEHDRWVKTELVRDVMSVFADAPREVIPVPIGHNARTSKEALALFGTLTSLVHRFLHGKALSPVLPKRKNLEIMRRAEKDRLPTRKLHDRKAYWRRYLIGEENLLGFEIMGMSDDYQQLMTDQIRALNIQPEDSLLDLGGGTGIFADLILRNGGPVPARITIADLIPQALKQARQRLLSHPVVLQGKGRFELMCLDLEMNRFRPVLRFLRGESPGFRELADRIENLDLESALKIENRYCPRLHRILRGQPLTDRLDGWLKSTFDTPEYRIITDLNQAARCLNRSLSREPRYQKLALPTALSGNLHLPFRPGSYNKVLMSLVLSYIFNPVETLYEIRRIIRPGGLLVLSSMRPDTDASGPFTRLMEKIEKMPAEALPQEWPKSKLLESLRGFLNDAQALVDLEEAGTFDFFDPEKLEGLLEESGWDVTQTIPSFGEPPQGYIMIAKAGDRNGRA